VTDLASIIARACAGDTARILRDELPIEPLEPRKSAKISDRLRMKVFLRDGFIDRYSGERLIFPGVLLLLSEWYPAELPYHQNWKLGACHPAYYSLYPTVDHIKPRSDRGADDIDNLVTTSQRNNTAKLARPLAGLGWTLRPSGDLAEWDGLLSWFAEQHARPGFSCSPTIEKWWRAVPCTGGSRADSSR
jgi:5-methylcytosine-specific restriction endonuclease McrA